MSDEYQERLKEKINEYREQNPSALSFDDFGSICIANGYAYQDFNRAYLNWAKREYNTAKSGSNGRNVPNNTTTNPHGLNQGTLNTMRAFEELAKDMIANGKGHLVGDFK